LLTTPRIGATMLLAQVRKCFFLHQSFAHSHLHSFPTRRSSDLTARRLTITTRSNAPGKSCRLRLSPMAGVPRLAELCHLPLHLRSEEHTSELQSRENLVCRLLLEKKKNADTSRATCTTAPDRHS